MVLIVILWCASFWTAAISALLGQWHVFGVGGFFVALMTLLAALFERRSRRRDGPWGPRP